MTSPSPRPPAGPPLDDLLCALRTRGIEPGVDRTLRLVQALDALAERMTPQDLPLVAAPLLATDEREQALVREAVVETYPWARPVQQPGASGSEGRQDPVSGSGTTSSPTEGPPPPTATATASSGFRRRRAAAVAAAAAVGAGAALSVLLLFGGGAPTAPGADPTAAPSPPPSAVHPVADPVADRPSTPPPPDDRAAEPREMEPERETVGEPSSTASRAPVGAPAADRAPTPLPWLRAAAVATPWILLAVWLATRRPRGRSRDLSGRPPFRWSVPIDATPTNPVEPERIRALSRELRRRVPGPGRALDPAATVAATVAAAGRARLRYRERTRIPEYLALVDRRSLDDHDAAWTREVLERLGEEAVPHRLHEFDEDPRRLLDGGRLDALAEATPEDRLLLFGAGDALLDPWSGDLLPFAEIFTRWRDRALLTPVPVSRWGARELELARLFLVVPFGTEGLGAVASALGTGVAPSVAPSADDRVPLPDLAAPTPAAVGALRHALGPRTFEWLAACAVHAQVQWNLTLHLASLPGLGPHLLDEDRLLRLARIPWFRRGTIPDDWRVALIAELPDELEATVRRELHRLLAAGAPPDGSVAREGRDLQLAVQGAWLRHHRGDEPEGCSDPADFPEGLWRRDPVALELVETVRRSVLDLALPRSARRILESLGVRRRAQPAVVAASLALAVSLVAALLPTSLSPVPPPPARVAETTASRTAPRPSGAEAPRPSGDSDAATAEAPNEEAPQDGFPSDPTPIARTEDDAPVPEEPREAPAPAFPPAEAPSTAPPPAAVGPTERSSSEGTETGVVPPPAPAPSARPEPGRLAQETGAGISTGDDGATPGDPTRGGDTDRVAPGRAAGPRVASPYTADPTETPDPDDDRATPRTDDPAPSPVTPGASSPAEVDAPEGPASVPTEPSVRVEADLVAVEFPFSAAENDGDLTIPVEVFRSSVYHPDLRIEGGTTWLGRTRIEVVAGFWNAARAGLVGSIDATFLDADGREVTSGRSEKRLNEGGEEVALQLDVTPTELERVVAGRVALSTRARPTPVRSAIRGLLEDPDAPSLPRLEPDAWRLEEDRAILEIPVSSDGAEVGRMAFPFLVEEVRTIRTDRRLGLEVVLANLSDRDRKAVVEVRLLDALGRTLASESDRESVEEGEAGVVVRVRWRPKPAEREAAVVLRAVVSAVPD